jgi:tripartite-type tricarboxylate transporter receptor subunit TctC
MLAMTNRSVIASALREAIPRRSRLTGIVAAAGAALLFVSTLALAQTYPSRPIRMLVSGVGGSSNFAARLIGPSLSEKLGQQVVIDNRGFGIVAIEIAAKSAPDGYTFILNGSTLWLMPFMREGLSYDPLRDFAPVVLVIRAPNVLTVHPNVAARSVKELIALAREKPEALNYATSGSGNSNHLAAELFKSMAHVKMVQINYKGAAPALTELLGGQVQVMFPTPGSVDAYVKAGRLRALAVTSAEPSPLLPGLPTIAASGLPGYECVSLFAVFAPARTPAPFVDRINRDIVEILNTPETKERFLKAGVEVVGGTPAHAGATVKAEMARWGKVIRAAQIRDP